MPGFGTICEPAVQIAGINPLMCKGSLNMECTNQFAKLFVNTCYDFCASSLIEYASVTKKKAFRIIDSYLDPMKNEDRARSLEDVYKRMASSLQNYGMRPNVIKFWELNNQYLYRFRHNNVLKVYGKSNLKLLKAAKRYNPSININGRIWLSYSAGLLDAARWLQQFNDFQEFIDFTNVFYEYGSTGVKLLANSIGNGRIHGMRLAIALDVLKELGIKISQNCAKPDVHVIKTLEGIKMIKTSGKQTIEDQLKAYDVIWNLSLKTKWTPYSIDKVIWLSNSGKYYNHFDRFWEGTQTPMMRRILLMKFNTKYKQMKSSAA